MPRGRKKSALSGVPASTLPEMPDASEFNAAQREALANWWRAHMDEIERRHAERVEALRNGGEHPTPAFARQVKEAGMLGMPRNLTAKLLGISPYTLEAYYADDYDLGAAEVIISVSANMVRIGTSLTDPNNAKVGMAILDRRGGQEWRPPAQKIITEDEREKPKNVIDTSGWDAADREQLRQMLLKNVPDSESESDGLAGGGNQDG
jgi:hypothetical protein